MGCCGTLGHIYLVVVNGLFMLFAIMLIVPGAVMLADVTYVNQKVVPLMKTLSVGSFNAADLADGLAIVMVAAGGVILFIATLGICGACKKARSCLCVYSLVVLSLIVAQIIAVVLWILMNAEAQSYLKSQLLSQLTNKYSNDDLITDEISTAFNFMFMTLECCAVNAVTGTTNDFDSTPWVTGGSAGSKNVPIFCCSGIDANSAGASFTTCTDSVSTGYYGIGCYDAFYNLIMKYSIYYIAVGITILVVETLGVFFACCMCKNLGKTENGKV
uniref:Tetraspanin n=1 Tax=Magallana gigas TaxID=29159 RepID=A0A8W8KXP3_MAGGI|nr:CD63 antigen [Crassostrea gigas]XP_034299584.1 CD63 antigen [Crassostrea gigas]